ncbi:putative organic cation transporter-like protein, partial [Leptotrombidium deliense]
MKNVTLENECISYENPNEPCTKWEYDKTVFWSTIVSEFDLVCQRSWFSSVAASSYQVGYAVSAILFGVISDKYGRRFALKISIYLEIVSGFSQAFSVSIYHFLFSRFFLGIAAFGRFFTGFLLIFECFGKKNRAPISAFIEFGWLFGKLIMPL